MNFCKSCGKELGAGQAFCMSCGAATQAAPSVTVQGNAAVVAAPASEAAPMATNVAGALTYALGLITGIIFLVTDPYKNNSFIRFHAYQSIFLNAACVGFWIIWSILSAILIPLTVGVFALIAVPLMLIFALLGFGVWIFLMYQAYQQKLFRLPVIGKYAAQQAGVKL